MQSNDFPLKKNHRPLQLPIELQSKSSDSTVADGPRQRDMPSLPSIFPYRHPQPLRPKTFSGVFLSSGKTRAMERVPGTMFLDPKMQRPGWVTDHFLNLDLSQERNKNEERCSKQILKMRCQKNCMHTIEVLRKGENELVIKFVDQHHKKTKMVIPNEERNHGQIILEFVKLETDLKEKEQKVRLFSGRLSKRNKFKFEINYERLRECMGSFFKNKPMGDIMKELNDFEYLFLGMFILNKRFVDWSMESFDLNVLQVSETRKRKEHFLKFLLKKLFKYLTTQGHEFFGKKNKEITDRMKSIFFEGTRRKKYGDPSSNRMENLGKVLSNNTRFKEFYRKQDMNQVLHELFEEYSSKQMDTLINNHVNRFRGGMEQETDSRKKIPTFVRLIMDLKKKKIKNMWTFKEFQQAKDVLDYIMSSN
jgi:hypothetical protein